MKPNIDKDSKVPLHFQIYEDIREKIESKQLLTGDKLLSESELQNLYGVSRITVRRAIQDLENEGFVKKAQGKGTIVCTPKQRYDLKRLTSFSEDITKHGQISSSIIREFNIIKADFKVAQSLNIEEGDEVYYLERIRLSGDSIVGLHKAYIRMSNEYTLDSSEFNEKTSLYDTLSKKGVEFKDADEILEAKQPDNKLKKILEMKESIPIFYKERVTYDTSGIPVEYVKMYYRSDVYQYKVKLNVSDDNNSL